MEDCFQSLGGGVRNNFGVLLNFSWPDTQTRRGQCKALETNSVVERRLILVEMHWPQR